MRRRMLLLLAPLVALLGCNRSGGSDPPGSPWAKATGGGSAAPALAPGHLAKPRVPAGWSEQDRKTYDAKTIFDYIDGGAEKYLRQGFRRLHAARYGNAGDEVTVDLYDLGRPENAAAIYAATPVPRPRAVLACDEAQGHDWGLKLRHGQVYGEITASRSAPELQAAAEAFARAVCGK